MALSKSGHSSTFRDCRSRGEAVKYLCLIYHDADVDVETFTSEQQERIRAEVGDVVTSFRANGHYVAASPLQAGDTAVTVRARSGAVTVTDGPFVETREQLAGFYFVEARDLNDAIRLMARTPSARLGSIEIRPVRDMGLDLD